MREPLHIPRIVLDRANERPLQRQIREQIAAALRVGTIPPDTRLPSTRMLASYLGVSRNTVLAAYDELAAEGWMKTRQGSGVYVSGVGTRPRTIDAIAKAAHFPSKRIEIEDPDGNSIAVNY